MLIKVEFRSKLVVGCIYNCLRVISSTRLKKCDMIYLTNSYQANGFIKKLYVLIEHVQFCEGCLIFESFIEKEYNEGK